MKLWAAAPQSRDQLILFAERLDEVLPPDHSVRLLDEVLGVFDWTAWEARYDTKRGRMAIHPRVLAGVLLYGLMTRIRSSRALEEALTMRLDFRWLVEGRTIDHTTLSEFRRQHSAELKQLFVQAVSAAVQTGLASLQQLGFDGTRVRANNRRSGTRTPDELREMRDHLQAAFDEFQWKAETADTRDEELFALNSQPELPGKLQDPDRRRAEIQAALDALDETKAAGGTVPKRVPITDLESRVMPNKDGGHAPNYTPTALVDIASGLIVGADVLAVVNEDCHLIPALDEARETFGVTPAEVMADGLIGTGANLTACEERGITLYSPCDPASDAATNPAIRADLAQPVAEADWDRLPTYNVTVDKQQEQRLDKSAFVYDAANNCYWCPLGQKLPYNSTTSEKSGSGRRIRDRYKADAKICAGCPLRDRCLHGKGTKARMINREQHEAARERHAQRMSQPESQAKYALRRHPGERPFAVIKHEFGLRQFLLRGREEVETEWRWAALAFNLKKLMSYLAAQRVNFRSRAGPQAA